MDRGQHTPITHTAFFRFYEELNDFLPEAQRKTTFSYVFRGTPTIKHTIEAIGVPHTEIDIILVNGESVGFEYRLQGGERVAVYPVFEAFDLTPAVTHGYWVRHENPNAQVREVVRRLQLEHCFHPSTRCSNCNEHLHPVDKALLHDRVPDETLRLFDAFMECERCKRVYWQGSHYERICPWIEELRGY